MKEQATSRKHTKMGYILVWLNCYPLCPKRKKRFITCWIFSSIEPQFWNQNKNSRSYVFWVQRILQNILIAHTLIEKKHLAEMYSNYRLSAAGWSAISTKTQDLITPIQKKRHQQHSSRKGKRFYYLFIKDALIGFPTCREFTAAVKRSSELNNFLIFFISFLKTSRYIPGRFLFLFYAFNPTHWCILIQVNGGLTVCEKL